MSSLCPPRYILAETLNTGADIVRELGMLCVEQSPLAPAKVYRSFKSKLRYDTEHEKGWAEHITNVSRMRIVEPPSSHSATGRIITVAGEVLDNVDVSLFTTHSDISGQ